MLMGAASTQARGYPLPSHQPPINASACPCLHRLPEQLAEPLLHTQTHKDTHLVHYPALYQGDGNLCLSSCQFPILFLPGIFQIKAVFVVIPSVRWNIEPLPYLWGNSTSSVIKIWYISEVTNWWFQHSVDGMKPWKSSAFSWSGSRWIQNLSLKHQTQCGNTYWMVHLTITGPHAHTSVNFVKENLDYE